MPTDLIFDLDPLWQPLAPNGFATPGNNLLSDQVFQFFPWKAFTVQWLAQGTLPLWNPHTNAGVPFIGNGQSAVFSPFNLVGYLFPLHASFTVTAVLRLFVASFFTFLFTRAVVLGQPAALLSMLTFTFCGPLVSWLGHPHSYVLVWLPAMLWATEKMLSSNAFGYVAAVGLSIAAQFLGGQPETSFHVMVTWIAYTLCRVATAHSQGWRSRLFHLARAIVATTFGTLLAAVQLLPFAEVLLQSATLSKRMTLVASSAPSLLKSLLLDWHGWPTTVTALLPQYFGTPVDRSYFYPYSNYIEQNLYVGILPLTLAALAVFRVVKGQRIAPKEHTLFFALLAVICLGVALRIPLLTIVNVLPVFALVANQRLRLIYAFACSVLAGIGMHHLVQDWKRDRRRIVQILAALALANLLLVAAAYAGFTLFKDEIIQSGRDFFRAHWGTPIYPHSLDYYSELVETRYTQKLQQLSPRNLTMYLPIVVAGSYLIFHALRRKSQIDHRLWALAVLGLTMLDLFLVGMPFHPTVVAQDIFPKPGAIRFIQQDQGVYRVSGTETHLYPNSGMVFGLSDIRGYETIVSERSANVFDQIEGSFEFHFHSLLADARSPLLDLLNVKYMVSSQELSGRWELVHSDASNLRVYRNQSVLPRAFVVYKAEIVDSAGHSLQRISDHSLDFRQTVILEEPPMGWIEPDTLPSNAPSVEFAQYEPNRVVLQVATDVSGLLVLTDTYAPGWKARLDGAETPVYVANHAFRAVVVPSGIHRVEFQYVPWSFWAGAMMSLLTATALALALLLKQFAPRRRGR